MGKINALGLGGFGREPRREPGNESVSLQRPLQRVLAFRGRSIDDIVNHPFVKNEIYGYWKVYRQIQRHGEKLELEKQWNHLGRRL